MFVYWPKWQFVWPLPNFNFYSIVGFIWKNVNHCCFVFFFFHVFPRYDLFCSQCGNLQKNGSTYFGYIANDISSFQFPDLIFRCVTIPFKLSVLQCFFFAPQLFRWISCLSRVNDDAECSGLQCFPWLKSSPWIDANLFSQKFRVSMFSPIERSLLLIQSRFACESVQSVYVFSCWNFVSPLKFSVNCM